MIDQFKENLILQIPSQDPKWPLSSLESAEVHQEKSIF